MNFFNINPLKFNILLDFQINSIINRYYNISIKIKSLKLWQESSNKSEIKKLKILKFNVNVWHFRNTTISKWNQERQERETQS